MRISGSAMRSFCLSSSLVATVLANDFGTQHLAGTPRDAALSSGNGGDNAHFCCNALASAGLAVHHPGSDTYEQSLSSYWSVAAQLRPYCISRPRSAAQVSAAVAALVHANKQRPGSPSKPSPPKPGKSPRCRFAVRSGGHTTWPGAASIENGVVLDLSLLNGVTVNGNGTVGVGSGARWGEVYEKLQGTGEMVTGGRASMVGVGGLLLGGGNSFYTARKGFAADGVVGYEIVLANGSITYVTRDASPDLFRALKGSSNNFGIVTRFDLATFPDEGIWGGVVTYPLSTADQHMQHLERFTERLEKDPYASVVVVLNYMSAMDQIIMFNTYHYTTAEGVDSDRPPEILKGFLGVQGNLSSSVRSSGALELTRELDQPAGYRDAFMTLTIKNDVEVMKYASKRATAFIEGLKAGSGEEDWLTFAMFQPLPKLFAKRSQERGGNVLGLDRGNENRIIFMCYAGWKSASNDNRFKTAQRRLIAEVRKYAEERGKDDHFVYLPYAYSDQKPLEGYGDKNVRIIREVARRYDPEGVFQSLVPGGFKISEVRR